MAFTALQGCDDKEFVQAAESMRPTIMPGRKVKINFDAYRQSNPDRWDIIAFRPKKPTTKNEIWIFRVAGLPGENISFEDDHILVDGKRIDGPSTKQEIKYRPHPVFVPRSEVLPYRVPTHSYFLLGDDSEIANDSRVWGSVSRDDIVGKVIQ